ncbi:Acyl-CoA reductase [Desulfofundulus australicus DSM 11792]|uniref:3-sulfolactaldehyde dehydrogenase n=1 Tax=Desulfofundulus australicus DSM 11792 TaxID=1121425 RepID=A0A1M4XJQ6_9FIRM|nr:aldehyde dehydrogenase family protein [Desulfofundulus australicus]SHE93626.1 Acyl-CoA reductase [Desulfofundulus australicus DSM 11792]
MEIQPLYINGEWRTTASFIPVTNKYSGEVIARVAVASRKEVEEAVTAAERAFRENTLTPWQRYQILSKASELLLARREELGMIIAREAGKALKDALGEVTRAANTCRVSAEEATRICGEMVPIGSAGAENRFAYTIRVPVGVVCAITPFNFPLNLVVHKVAPAIAAGNTVVLKPASATPLSSLSLCRILEEAGLPPGHLNVLVGSGDDVGEMLLRDPRVAHFSFTGSPAVGRRIAERAGLRRVTLELGSNSATIVHSDADLVKAARACGRMAFVNAGQVCISVQRILVQQDVAEPFCQLLVEEAEKLVVGDPTDLKTDVGPMISEDAARRAEQWVREAVAGGATVLTGGRREGNLFYPTVLTGVRPDMKVVCEEIFAPVVSVIPYENFEQALEMANDSPYGLQAGVFTRSLDLAMLAARKLEVGGVIINDTSVYRADEMPYGGVKGSGMGREGPKYAIQEMTETRVVVITL